MKMLNMAIIGCGSIAPTHIWAIDENSGAQLRALCDIDEEKMERLNKSRNCLLFNDWKEMLTSPQIDVAVICLPHHLHAPAIINALKAGKHVISEKPLAVDLEQIREIKAAAEIAEKKGIYSFGIFQHRYSSLIQRIRREILKGALGTIIEGEINFLCKRDCSYYRSDLWRGLWSEEGGGIMINQGIHTMDILFQLLGHPKSVNFNLFREKLSCIEVEDRGTGRLIYDRSVLRNEIINLHFENDLKTDWDPRITLKGTKGDITILGSEKFTCTDPDLTEELNRYVHSDEKSAPGKECYGSLHSANYNDIISCISRREEGEQSEAEVSLFSLAETTEIILALYQSHFQKKSIELPLNSWETPKTLQS